MNNYEWLLFCNFQPFRMAIHSWYSLFAHIIICHICWSEPLSGFGGNFTLHSTRDPSLFLSVSVSALLTTVRVRGKRWEKGKNLSAVSSLPPTPRDLFLWIRGMSGMSRSQRLLDLFCLSHCTVVSDLLLQRYMHSIIIIINFINVIIIFFIF